MIKELIQTSEGRAYLPCRLTVVSPTLEMLIITLCQLVSCYLDRDGSRMSHFTHHMSHNTRGELGAAHPILASVHRRLRSVRPGRAALTLLTAQLTLRHSTTTTPTAGMI